MSQWAQGSRFESLQARALDILSEKDKVCAGQVFQDHVYFLWQDADHPLGVWRRAPLESFQGEVQWEGLLDLDAYSNEKGQATFLRAAHFLEDSSRVLLFLSPNGGDASDVFEWDLKTKSFVRDGFHISLSKDYAIWAREDQVLWASTEKPSHCGYPTRLYSWKRNQPPKLIFEIPAEHSTLFTFVIRDQSKNIQVFIGDIRSWDEAYLYHWENQTSVVSLNLPPESSAYGSFQDRLLLFLKKDWGAFPSGSLLIAKQKAQWSQFTESDFEVLFEPTEKKVFQDLTTNEKEIFIVISDNLKKRILRWTPEQVEDTPLPEGVNVSSVYASEENDRVFSVFQSFTEPLGWYEWRNGSWHLLQKGKQHFRSENMISQQEWAVSADGTQVPYWIVYDRKFSGPRPALQLGYGGFLSAMFPTYSGINGALWIERGGLFVLSQIRGGSEFGPKWHEAAKLENKQRSYDDFIAISEDLIRKGYTTEKQLAVQGRSNGGLLVGATITQRPDLYGAALIEVPLLDMIRYVELPPGSSWIGEYGDPRDPKFREIILRYSPYQNIEKHAKYPPILIRTARSDDRVHPGHARKMAAKMQALGHSVFFFEEELGGHGLTPLKDRAFQHALVFEFLWRNLEPDSQF